MDQASLYVKAFLSVVLVSLSNFFQWSLWSKVGFMGGAFLSGNHTKTIFVRLYYPGFNAKASDQCWASLIMETQFLCTLAFLEIELPTLVGLLGWLFDEASAVMFDLFLFPPTYTLCVWIIGTLSMLITRWRYMLTGILYWNIVCIEYQVEMCLQTWLGLSWKDLFTPHFCQSIAWITDDLTQRNQERKSQ